MPIKIDGKVNVAAPRDQVWDSIFDLDVMRGVIARVPGITLERLEQIDDMNYEVTATVGVAAIKGKYDGKIAVLEKTPPSYVKIKGDGKGGGNWTSGEVALNLLDHDGTTEMQYSGQGNLNGPLASLGQRLVDSVGKQFIDQGAKVFAAEIEQRVGVPAEMEVVKEPEPYGFMFEALLTLIVLGTIIALIVFRTLQSAPR